MWLSVDPLAEKYPNVSPYAYTFQNPIKYIDPRGLEGVEPGDPPKERELPEVVITGKRSSWFNRNIWRPLTSVFRNTTKISGSNENRYVTSTKSYSQVMSIPENKFFSASINTTTTFGNTRILNIDNKVSDNLSNRTKEISQDHQIDLSIVKGNTEITKESVGVGVGVSFLGRADIGVGITLNSDILNSEIFLSGSENINKDSNSNGFSIGIKPVSIIIGGAIYGLRRLAPPIVLDPAIYSPIFGPPQHNDEIF